MTGSPFAGKGGAPGLHRGANGRIDLAPRLGGRCRHLLPPLVQRGRGDLPGRGELPRRGVCVTGSAVMTRRVGQTDVRLCAPCAVAQGFAEFSR